MATILFPTDFSHASDAALEHAEALAKQRQAKLLICMLKSRRWLRRRRTLLRPARAEL